jgi:hypothetical protein
MDHQWRAAVLHLCLNPCRALPVAHPGCPVDHIQTLVNQSPGDLWMRCIGSILFVFCYLALGNEQSTVISLCLAVLQSIFFYLYNLYVSVSAPIGG